MLKRRTYVSPHRGSLSLECMRKLERHSYIRTDWRSHLDIRSHVRTPPLAGRFSLPKIYVCTHVRTAKLNVHEYAEEINVRTTPSRHRGSLSQECMRNLERHSYMRTYRRSQLDIRSYVRTPTYVTYNAKQKQ